MNRDNPAKTMPEIEKELPGHLELPEGSLLSSGPNDRHPKEPTTSDARNWVPLPPPQLSEPGQQRRTLLFRCPSTEVLRHYIHEELDDFEMSSVKFHLMAYAACPPNLETTVAEVKNLRSTQPRQDGGNSVKEGSPVSTRPSEAGSEPGDTAQRLTVRDCSVVRSAFDSWGVLKVDVETCDTPGFVFANTEPFAKKELFLNDIEFVVLDDHQRCRLRFEAEGPWREVADFENLYKNDDALTQKLGLKASPCVVLEHPYLFAFVVQFCDGPGIAARIASIISKVRSSEDASEADNGAVPSGTIVSFLGQQKQEDAPEQAVSKFIAQGLVAAPNKEVQRAVVRELLDYFQNEEADRWFMGNFGRPYLPTRFLSDVR